MTNGKQVRDAYVTLAERMHDNMTHPFVTFLRFTDGSHSQEVGGRNLRDCLIAGNSMLSALAAVGIQYETINVVFDERLNKGI